MNDKILKPVLLRFNKFIKNYIGVYFPDNHLHNLERKITLITRKYNSKKTESFIEWLISAPITKEKEEIIIKHFTVGETYFFRDKRSFDYIEKQIIPELIYTKNKKDKNIKIWSAGCSTGEEPYTIAMLLKKYIPDMTEWNITILGTDINPHSLSKAVNGIYTKWSFREMPEWAKKSYFQEIKEDQYKIHPDIQKMVKFSQINLVTDEYPSSVNNSVDMIFCRNVLMYLDNAKAEEIVKRFSDSLIDGGLLFVSIPELSLDIYNSFTKISNSETFFLKKEGTNKNIKVIDEKEQYSLNKKNIQSKNIKLDDDLTTTIKLPPSILKERTKQSEDIKVQIAIFEKSKTLFKQGKYQEVIKILTDLLSNRQIDANTFPYSEAVSFLSRSYANQGDLIKALTWCKKAIDIDKVNPEYHYLCSIIFQEQNKIEEAIASLKRVLYLDSNFILAHYTLGNIMLTQEKMKESKRHFNNAIEILSKIPQEEELPESDGITAGRLKEIITSIINKDILI